MALSNHERVGKAMELLRLGLAPFVEREFRAAYKDDARAEALKILGEDRILRGKPVAEWDAAALLRLMWESWNSVFRKALGHAERSLVSELRDARHKWAHQQAFSSDDAYRVLDSVGRLLSAVSAPEAAEVERLKMELLRVRFDEQMRSERRKAAHGAIESQAAADLRPWREVVTPHPDVASGRYQQAEFAADLWQVHLGEGADEYRDPAEFFRRTYLTESLRRLLVGAVARLSGKGGDPVVQLQTNFGGGKTHSMLALYHLFSGRPPGDLAGVDALLAEADLTEIPKVRRAVLVGNKISPGNPVTKPDGTVVRTLWGELAWQLGGKKAYERIRADDERATSPGDALRELFREYGPCLVLIDEWVAYARQLHEESDLPGGSFETQFSFAQALTESAKLAPACLLVVSLPASDTAQSPHAQADDVEVGGQRGREALERLRNVIGRVESSWRPATAEEGFEIVRRRLFQPLVERSQFVARDTVARAFFDLYRTQRDEFPPESRDADYEKRLKAAYPIHPEIFDRLYTDWSTLVKFQRTRGVLRLLAAVVHSLWEKGDKSPLVLPCHIPIDDPRVQFELTRYLSDNWVPVLEKDVDGPQSLPVRMDGEVPNLGKYSACRRVARTIYLGSAPTTAAANRGIEDRRVRLGCVLPGEPSSVFGDALRRMAAAATYLYQDGPRYWYSTQPTVTKLAEDLAEQLLREPDKVAMEVERRVRENLRKAGDFVRVHPFPRSSQDVPDDRDARLVVLDIEHPHAKEPQSPAETLAREILSSRGAGPRLYANTLAFLAADRARLLDLDEAARRYLAWQSICDDKDRLDLTQQQIRQAEDQKKAASEAVDARLPETYQWLLVPVQERPQADVSWKALRLSGQDPLAVRASKRLRHEELLLPVLGPARLRMELDRVPLWRGDHVEVKTLVDDFARYLYLPRLRDPSVLIACIQEGVGLLTWQTDSFAFAEAYDETRRRYLGLVAGRRLSGLAADSAGLLVKPEVARRQMEEEARDAAPAGQGAAAGPGPAASAAEAAFARSGEAKPPAAEKRLPRRYHGTVALDPLRVGRDASRIADEVVTHLVGLVGADVKVTLEIDARVTDGVPDQVVRIVTENSRTLKFESYGFEDE